MPATDKFYVQLSLKDYEKFKRDLESGGPAAKRAMAAIERAIQKPNLALKGLDEASRQVSESIRGMASAAGPAGDALSAMGTGGLAAAAAIGAVTGALIIGIRKTSEALKVYGAMTDQADQLGLSFERFQELTYGFGDVGVDADKTTRALTKLNDALGEILIRGDDAPKELIIAFDALGISIEDIQRSGGDMDEMLGRIADGLRNLGTTQERTSAFTAIFGQKMAALVPIFVKGSQGLDDMAQRARDAGAVISNELGAAMDRVADRTEQLNTIIRAQETGFLVPFIENWNVLREAYVDVLTSMNQLTDAFPEMNQFITSQLTIVGTLAEAWREAKTAYDKFFPDRSFYYNRKGAAGELLAERQAAAGAYGPQLPPPAQDRGLVIEINDPNSVVPGRPPVKPEKLAAFIERLKKFDAPIKDKTAKTQKKFTYNTTGKPAPGSFRAAQEISAQDANAGFLALQDLSTEQTKLHEDGLKQLEELKIAALRSNGDIEEAITRRKELDVAAWKQQAEQSGLSAEQTAEGVQAIEEQAQAAIEAANGIGAAFEHVATLIGGVLADVLLDFATGAEVTAQSVARSFARVFLQQGIQQLISAGTTALGAAVSAGFAGGSGTTAAPAGTYGGQYSGTTTTGTAAYTFHGGGRVGIDPVATRYVHPAYFENAPRFHEGLMSGEYPAILKYGETVRTSQQEAALNRPFAMNVTVNNNAGAEVSTSQDDQGNLQVDIERGVDRAMAGVAGRRNSEFNRMLRSQNQTYLR